MELFNTVIGVLALIISIIALFHSIYYNLVKIRLSHCKVSRVNEKYNWLYSFYISNLSNISVIIKKIELFDEDGNLLVDNNFDPSNVRQEEYGNSARGTFGIPKQTSLMYLNREWFSSPFKHEVEVYPVSREKFSYYLDKAPASIKITTNKRIYKFRKSQLFFPHFDHDD